jgi:hypothetical protein
MMAEHGNWADRELKSLFPDDQPKYVRLVTGDVPDAALVTREPASSPDWENVPTATAAWNYDPDCPEGGADD